MGAMFLFTLKETCKECGASKYEYYIDHGEPFVWCPVCEKAWEPCESAWDQFRLFCIHSHNEGVSRRYKTSACRP